MSNEFKEKSYTFDYSGNLIRNKEIKKFPIGISLQSTIEKVEYIKHLPEGKALRKKIKTLSTISNSQEMIKKNFTQNYFQQKEAFNPYSIIDHIQVPDNGVFIKEESNVKKGQRMERDEINSTSLANEGSIRLSKNEYRVLIQGGSLSRPYELEERMNKSLVSNTSQSLSKLPKFEISALDSSVSKINYEDSILSKDNNSVIKIQNMTNMLEESNVGLSAKHLEMLLGDNHSSELIYPAKEINTLKKNLEKIELTDNDELNLRLLDPKNFAEPSKRGLPSIIKKPQKTSLDERKKSCGELFKYPRERAPESRRILPLVGYSIYYSNKKP